MWALGKDHCYFVGSSSPHKQGCIDIVDLDDDNLSDDEEQTMEIEDECFVRTEIFHSL